VSLRVLHFGMGPIGAAIARQVATRPGFSISGAVDIDPDKAGRDVGQLLQLPSTGTFVYRRLIDALEKAEVDVVVICTSSSLAKVMPQIVEVLHARIPIVSTTEELAYPTPENRAFIAQIDEHAKRVDVAVMATGVNPGFVMDALPIVLTSPCERIDAIRIDRVQDASARRLPFQQKIGTGLSVSEFQEKVRTGLVRHVGLAESIHMIGDALAWNVDQVTDRIEPVVAQKDVHSDYFKVSTGRVCGLVQDGVGYVDKRPVITLHMEAYLGAPQSYDNITIRGSPNLEFRVLGGTPGDVATASLVVNALPKVVAASPGYHTMRDMPLPSFFGGQSKETGPHA
jgi:hypothetical protein